MKRDYGIVFQSYALFPNLTIFDNVAYGLVNRRKGRAEIRRRVARAAHAGRTAATQAASIRASFPAGQQQRIALARALATAPGLLLLDEPLSALDALERLRLRGEIRALQQRLGVTTIMVTHDQEEALSMADRVVVMNHGVIEQIGTPQQIYREPASAFVADFVGKVNVISAVAEGGGRFRVGALVAGRRGRRCGGCAGHARQAVSASRGRRHRRCRRGTGRTRARRNGDQGRVPRRLLPRYCAGRRRRGPAAC